MVKDQLNQAEVKAEAFVSDVDEAFVSAVDIGPGESWLEAISNALTGTKVMVVLCSPRSIKRSWVNFESGAGWKRNIPVIPVCHGGLRKEELPYPLSIFQGLDLDNENDCKKLVERIAQILKTKVVEGFSFEQMTRSLAIQPPQRTSDIGIALTHGQARWDAGPRSVFKMPKSLPQQFNGRWTFRYLEQIKYLLSDDLHGLSGLIVAMPFRRQMEAEVVSALTNWVKMGGRLLLLGFELGDRHHSGNLGDLSRVFGIHPRADIVGPPDYGSSKPYEVPVDFEVSDADSHTFTKDLHTIQLANVQTLYVEPGGIEWLRVGKNVVYRPAQLSVVYREGTLTQPKAVQFERNKNGNWLPIAAEAPRGLCGAGSVQAIGTWDLLGRDKAFTNEDNLKLMERLLDWLSNRDSPDKK